MIFFLFVFILLFIIEFFNFKLYHTIKKRKTDNLLPDMSEVLKLRNFGLFESADILNLFRDPKDIIITNEKLNDLRESINNQDFDKSWQITDEALSRFLFRKTIICILIFAVLLTMTISNLNI